MKNKLLFISILLLSINYTLYNTIYAFNGKMLIRIIAVFFMFLHIIFNWNSIRIKPQDVMMAFFMVMPFIMLPINDKVVNVSLLLLIIIGSRTSNYKEIIKKLFNMSIINIFLILIMHLMGVISNINYTIGERTRYTFGFLNVNGFSLLIYSMSMLYILSRKELKLIHLIITTIVSVGIFVYTDTRSVLVSTLFFMIFYLVLQRLRREIKLYIQCEPVIHLLNILPILILIWIIKPRESFYILDIFTSYRLSIIINYIHSNSWLNFIFGGTQIADIDNGLLLILYSLGMFFSIYILIQIFRATHIAYRAKNIREIAFITSFLVYNTVESAIIRPEILITIVFWIIIFNLDFISNHNIMK